jgi:dipeptidyl aminopeptidase/acylaminoacyl peptidase
VGSPLTRRFVVAAACGALLAATLGAGPASPRTLESADIGRIVNLEQPAISPDGRRIAFVVIRPDVAHATYASTLTLIDVATREQLTLVDGHDVSDPRWSPDGTRLAYLATADNGKSELFVRDVAPAAPSAAPSVAAGVATQLTHCAGDVIDMAWRPDGAELAFGATDAPAFRDPGGRHHTFFEAGDNEYTALGPASSVHLWLVRADGTRARRLTSGSWTLPPTDRGGIFAPQFAWTRDARAIVFTKVASAEAGDDEDSTLARIDLASGRVSKLTGHRALEFSPQFSPDGSRLAYSYARDGDFLSENELYVRGPGGEHDLTRALDRNVGGALWLPGGAAFLACGDDAGRSRAWIVPTAGKARVLDLGPLEIVCDSYSSSTFDAGIAASFSTGGALAFLATTARAPRELFYVPKLGATPRKLTRFGDVLRGVELGASTPFLWHGPLGRETGVLTGPPGRRSGRRYPIVVLVHGGPGLAAIADFAWEDWPLAQLIAAHGYVVFQPNYRGSDDNGNAFMRAIYRDTVAGPSADILSGLAAVERLPQADPARTAVCGWSYGGLLTSWLIEGPHRWRAAVSGAAVNDEIESYALSVSNVQNRYYLGSSPYLPGGEAFYRSQSPIEFASRIHTPTLIWGTAGDTVVPVTMSYALFHALRDRDVPTKLIVFPSATHGPADPAETEDLTDAWLGWLDRYLH